jgi:hypothetical protein
LKVTIFVVFLFSYFLQKLFKRSLVHCSDSVLLDIHLTWRFLLIHFYSVVKKMSGKENDMLHGQENAMRDKDNDTDHKEKVKGADTFGPPGPPGPPPKKELTIAERIRAARSARAYPPADVVEGYAKWPKEDRDKLSDLICARLASIDDNDSCDYVRIDGSMDKDHDKLLPALSVLKYYAELNGLTVHALSSTGSGEYGYAFALADK